MRTLYSIGASGLAFAGGVIAWHGDREAAQLLWVMATFFAAMRAGEPQE